MIDYIKQKRNPYYRWIYAVRMNTKWYRVAQRESDRQWECSCPDWRFRHSNDPVYTCKHIDELLEARKTEMVLIRVERQVAEALFKDLSEEL